MATKHIIYFVHLGNLVEYIFTYIDLMPTLNKCKQKINYLCVLNTFFVYYFSNCKKVVYTIIFSVIFVLLLL
jgi:hypothetical protein